MKRLMAKKSVSVFKALCHVRGPLSIVIHSGQLVRGVSGTSRLILKFATGRYSQPQAPAGFTLAADKKTKTKFPTHAANKAATFKHQSLAFFSLQDS